MSKNYEEKRDYLRMIVEFPIELYNGQSDKPTLGRCINLSGSGLLVETDTKLKLGSQWHADVISELLQIPTLKLRCEVLRAENKVDKKYRSGLKILEVIE